MRTARAWRTMGGAALMASAAATASVAQTGHRGPPSIRIYSANGVDVINTSSYVQPEIELSENAYVFVVAMDLDGQIQVMHPDFPGIEVKISAHKQLHLPNFFAGFNQQSFDGVYYSAQFQHYTRSGGWGDTRGVAIALASRAPFNLERIEVGGNWDMVAIRHLIENRTPQEAMLALATYIGAEGEPIGRDYMRFAGGSNSYAYDYGYDYYDSYYSPCSSYYSYFYAPGRGFAALAKASGNGRGRVGVQAKIVGYDWCGVPIISYGPVVQGRFPQPGQPRTTGDTTVFPKGRFPRGAPRHPPLSASLAAPQGVFPVSHRTDLPQMGDVTIRAPKGRRSEPGQGLSAYGSTVFAAPVGRPPIERVIPSGQPIAASGGESLRESRREPLVEAPPPSRVPERHDAPAPVVHEQPSTPPPPPPRVAPTPTSTTTRTEPLRAAPPNR